MPKIALATVLFFVSTLLISCSGKTESTDSAPRTKTVGVSLLTQQHDFYKDLEAAMKKTAEAKGIRLVIHSAEFDPARQASQLEDFISQKVDAIVVSPCDSSGIATAIGKANKANIPVFTADIAAAGGQVVSHVASDNEQGGRLAAQTLAKYIDQSGDIVVLDHPEVASVQDRVRGFTDEIKKFPKIRILDKPSAGGLRDKAHSITENMLQSHRELKGIFAINDDTALGALRAAATNASLSIVGYDATPEARKEIARGSSLKADVVQYPDRIGAKTIELIAEHFAGKTVPPRVGVEVGIVDRDLLKK